jgi:Tfp pilus assembly protein PilF
MRSLLPMVCVLLALMGPLGQPADAQERKIEIVPTAVTPADRAACLTGAFTDDRTAVCTRVIESGQFSGADLVRAYLLRGLSFVLFADDCADTAPDAEAMIKLDPKNSLGYALRGTCAARTGDFDHALADLNQALGINPNESIVHNGFGIYYNGKRDFDRAIAESNEALRLNGRSESAYRTRGLAYENKGDLNKAVADFRQAIAIDPQRKQIPAKEAAEGLKRIEQGIAAIGAADWTPCFNGPNGDDKIAACTRLISSGKLGNGDLSQAFFQRAVSQLIIKNDVDRAFADFNEVISLDPKNATAFAIRGAVFVRKGIFDRAIADLSEGLRLNPNSAAVHNDFGVYYNATGDYDRALVELNEALRLFPQYLYAYKNRGITYEHKGELAAALADFRVALSYDPNKRETGGKEAAEGIARVESRLAAASRGSTTVVAVTGNASSLAVVPGRRVALIIGNDKYDSLQPLQKAVNDARAVAEHLGKLGFDVILVENANRRTMSEKLTVLTGKIGRGDTAFVFYAGHGVAIKDGNYLLPTDTPQVNEGQESLLTREGIGADTIIDALQERGARVIVMVLDACRENPFKKAGSRGVGTSGGLGEMRAPEGVFVLYSAGFGQTALDRLSDNDANANSVFTRTFVQLLDRPGLSLQELAKITQTEVKKLSGSVNHVQMPAYYDQIDGALALR